MSDFWIVILVIIAFPAWLIFTALTEILEDIWWENNKRKNSEPTKPVK